MTAYINLTKMIYPMFKDDIVLYPDDHFEPVVWVDEPIIDQNTERCYEGTPQKNEDGRWYMVWLKRSATQAEVEQRNLELELKKEAQQ